MRKSIAITGAASGIGKATAEMFFSKGWYVGLFDINEKNLTSLFSKFDEKSACMRKMDVSDPESVKDAIHFFSEKTDGKMNVLFNCAGILQMGHHEKIPLKIQKKIVDVNLTGMLNCIDASFHILKNTDDSRIINMSSGSATYGTPELAVYSSTKFAVRGLTEALNIEFEDQGIWVCDIMAPFVSTPMIMKAEQKASSVRKLGVWVSPDQVAEIVWKAAHGRKVHWIVSVHLKLLMILTKIGNMHVTRFLVKLLAFSSRQVSKKMDH